MTLQAGSGLGNNVYDFKKKRPMTTGAEFGLAVNECQAMVPGSRGGGDAKAIQAEAVRDTMEFLKGIQ